MILGSFVLANGKTRPRAAKLDAINNHVSRKNSLTTSSSTSRRVPRQGNWVIKETLILWYHPELLTLKQNAKHDQLTRKSANSQTETRCLGCQQANPT